MKKLSLLILALFVLPAVAADKDEAKGKAVPFTSYLAGYFEKNTSGLKGDTSYLVITDQDSFDNVFGVGVTMGKKPDFLPKDVFDKRIVVAVIKRGKAIWVYQVQKVTVDGGTLYVQFEDAPKNVNFMAASPMIASVDKGDYKEVVFIENGKKVETVNVDTSK